MVRFAAFLARSDPTEARLREYVKTRGEWVGREFKKADSPSVFGLRIAVAAFANTDGGDLFLGVDNTGTPWGTPVDPKEISHALNQAEAKPRRDYLTNLVPVAGEPRIIPLTGLPPVYWFDVAAQGRLVAVLKSNGSLGLYDRPGAESEEVQGFDAIDLFRSKTRARLLYQLYAEFERIVASIPQHYTQPSVVRNDTIRPILSILESEEWKAVANAEDRNLESMGKLGPLLSFPQDAENWEGLPWQIKGEKWRYRTLTELPTSRTNIRNHVKNERIILPD